MITGAMDRGLHVIGPVRPSARPRSAALFLDRDGTLMLDRAYLADPAGVELMPDLLPALRHAMGVGLPLVVVTNQSGVERGLITWADYEAVAARLSDLLAAQGVQITLTLACGWLKPGGTGETNADHPLRKPNPGMLAEAAKMLDLDLSRSLIIGDRWRDLEAGRRAGLAQGFLLGSAEVVVSANRDFAVTLLNTPGASDRLRDAITAAARPPQIAADP